MHAPGIVPPASSPDMKGNERMCGIVGSVGRQEAQPILVEGLHRLEYCGYDSAGTPSAIRASPTSPDAGISPRPLTPSRALR